METKVKEKGVYTADRCDGLNCFSTPHQLSWLDAQWPNIGGDQSIFDSMETINILEKIKCDIIA